MNPFVLLPLELVMVILQTLEPWDVVLWSLASREHMRLVYLMGYEWLRMVFLRSCKTALITEQTALPVDVVSKMINQGSTWETADLIFTDTVLFTQRKLSVLLAPWENATGSCKRQGTWVSFPEPTMRDKVLDMLIPRNSKQSSRRDYQHTSNVCAYCYVSREIYAGYLYSCASACYTLTQKALMSQRSVLHRVQDNVAAFYHLASGLFIMDFTKMKDTYCALEASPLYDFGSPVQMPWADPVRALNILTTFKALPNRYDCWVFLLRFGSMAKMHDRTYGVSESDEDFGSSQMIKDGISQLTGDGRMSKYLFINPRFAHTALMGHQSLSIVTKITDAIVHQIAPDAYGAHFCPQGTFPQPHTRYNAMDNMQRFVSTAMQVMDQWDEQGIQADDEDVI